MIVILSECGEEQRVLGEVLFIRMVIVSVLLSKNLNKTFTVDILVGLIMTTLQEVVLVWCKSCTFSRVRVNEGLLLPEFTPNTNM